MHPTDTTEKGLEALIVRSLIDEAGYLPGDLEDYDREHGVDLAHLVAFLRATQPEMLDKLGIEVTGPRRTQFLHRLQGEVARRGVIDVLRRGIKHGPHHIDLFYGTPSPNNLKAVERFEANRFSVTRQLRYSRDETQLSKRPGNAGPFRFHGVDGWGTRIRTWINGVRVRCPAVRRFPINS